MATAPLLKPRRERMTEPGTASHADERALVARAQRGDVAAFEALYHATSGRVFALCMRMAGDQVHATELMQDVFVKIWEKLSLFRGESAFSTWVHRLAINTVLETRRKEGRRGNYEERGSNLEEREESRTEERATRPRIEDRLDLEAAISKLPPGARQVFVLHDVEGYQHNEIAKMTGLAEGTLRAQLHRARKLLMEMLER
ncbi:MAG TPA: RNA polymerase sigma factor [Gemmatimonadaceae bacterium]|nr:RNA polymerase sigma factor [Gemmatimonadaceae bacterium]